MSSYSSSSPSSEAAVGESGLNDAPVPIGSEEFYAAFDAKCTSRENGKGKVYAKHLSLLLDVGKQESEMGRNMDARTANVKGKETMDSVKEKHKCEREEWEKVLENEIHPYYDTLSRKTYPKVNSFKSLLELRVVPPLLAALDEASRSSSKTESRKRRYPPEIFSWSDFMEEVQKHQPEAPNLSLEKELPGHYHRNLFNVAKSKYLADELDEQTYLLKAFETILASTEARPPIQTHAHGVTGRPDFYMMKGKKNDGKPVLVGEMKSTQNLFLPELSSDVVSQYKLGYKDGWKSEDVEGSGPVNRRDEYANICHPLAQLMEYMITNTCRFGILSSGTRSYFCFIDGNGSPGKPLKFSVSDACFVGEPNYIKAWVYMYDKGKERLESRPDPEPAWNLDWKSSSPKDPSPWKNSKKPAKDDKDKHRDRQDDKPSSGAGGSGDRKSGGRQKVTQLPISELKLQLPADCDGLPYVAEENLEFMGSIGHGFHGTAFKVRVNGAEAALKQFDANKGDVPGFLKEVSAYARLKSVWGELVPELLFVSESMMGNILYLGLQLGKRPETVDYHKWQQVLWSLEKDYGVRHNDADDTHNTVLIPDKKSGGERLAIIDFEDCDLLDPPNLPQC